MSLNWGDDPASREEQDLQRFLDGLQKKIEDTLEQSEQVRAEWKEALKKPEWNGPSITEMLARSEQYHKAVNKMPKPIWTNSCPYCLGEGRITHVDTDFRLAHTINHVCPGCHGSGKSIETVERRGVR